MCLTHAPSIMILPLHPTRDGRNRRRTAKPRRQETSCMVRRCSGFGESAVASGHRNTAIQERVANARSKNGSDAGGMRAAACNPTRDAIPSSLAPCKVELKYAPHGERGRGEGLCPEPSPWFRCENRMPQQFPGQDQSEPIADLFTLRVHVEKLLLPLTPDKSVLSGCVLPI
jgi:hypothetical protein